MPSWAFDNGFGHLFVNPRVADNAVGEYIFRFHATDGSGFTDSDLTWKVTVLEKNVAPSTDVAPGDSLECDVGTPCSFSFVISDGNSGDTHTVTVEIDTGGGYTVEPWITATTSSINLDPTSNSHAVLSGNLKLTVEDDNSVNDSTKRSVISTISLVVNPIPN